MIRRLMLALAILITAAGPGHTGGGGGSHGSHGQPGHRHHHRHHFHQFVGVYALYPFYPNCWWEEEHQESQLYMDRYGNSTSVPEMVPGRWMCWY